MAEGWWRSQVKAGGCRQLPPLCACHRRDPLDPVYSFACACNCALHRNWEQYERLLKGLLVSRGLSLPESSL